MKEITIDGVEYVLTPKDNQKVYSDWRLPTLKELLTIVDYSRSEPASTLEDTISDYYWSSTSYAPDTVYAWLVDFYYGVVRDYAKTTSFYVRCIRDGEQGLEWSASSEQKMDWEKAYEYAAKLVAPVYWKEKQ
jgi:hypothetical protein